MIWLLPRPLPPLPSASFLSFPVFLCVADPAYCGWGEGGGAKSYDSEKAWSSVNQAIFSGLYLPNLCIQFLRLKKFTRHLGRKYAKWKAAYIHNCLKSGQTPVAGPLATGEDQEEEQGIDQEQGQFFVRNISVLVIRSGIQGPPIRVLVYFHFNQI